eukprot:11109_1
MLRSVVKHVPSCLALFAMFNFILLFRFGIHVHNLNFANSISGLELHRLPEEYQCFLINDSITSRTCRLPNNITIILDKQIGSDAGAVVWSTKVYRNNSMNYYDIYVMKMAHNSCGGLQREYYVYKYLQEFYKHNVTEINIPSIHPFIPFYTFMNNMRLKYSNSNITCFFFMSYLVNKSSLETFSNTQTIESFNKID